MYVCTYYLSIFTYWLYILHRNSPLHARYITEFFTGSCTESFFTVTIQRTVSSVQIVRSSSNCTAYCKIQKIHLPLSCEHRILYHDLVKKSRKLEFYSKERLSGHYFCSFSSIFRSSY